jgi:hypothetical protein
MSSPNKTHISNSDLPPILMPYLSSYHPVSSRNQLPPNDGIVLGPFTREVAERFDSHTNCYDFNQYVVSNLHKNPHNRIAIQCLLLMGDPYGAMGPCAGTPSLCLGTHHDLFLNPVNEAIASGEESAILAALDAVGYNLHDSGSRLAWFPHAEECFVNTLRALQHEHAQSRVAPLLFEMWRHHLIDFRLFVDHGGAVLLPILADAIPTVSQLNIDPEDFSIMLTYLDVACKMDWQMDVQTYLDSL